MNTRLIFALFLVWTVCVSTVFATDCNNPTLGCASTGSPCTGDFIQNPNGCDQSYDNSTCCAPGLYCVDSLCVTDNIGESCNTTNQCYAPITSGLTAICDNQECYLQYLPGDECDTSLDCMYNLTCSNDMCQGIQAGGNCASSLLGCGNGLYCNLINQTYGTCTPRTDVGGRCMGTDECVLGSNCLKTANASTCVAHFTVNANGTCQSLDDCIVGYYCNYTLNGGSCSIVPEDFDTCSNTTESCQQGFNCMCSPFSGESYCIPNYLKNTTVNMIGLYTGYVFACTEEASDADSCMKSNNCTLLSDAENSCSYQNCYSEVKSYYSCGCDINEDWYDSCAFNPYCGGFPTWAIIVIIVVAIVIVLAIVLLVFFMMRKRREYDAII